MKNYNTFLESKKLLINNSGINISENEINTKLFDFQKKVVLWALKKGKACIFQDCGLGKTIQQLEWGRIVQEDTKKPVLLVTPIAVAIQTKKESEKFGIESKIVVNNNEVQQTINITNYEKLHKFDLSKFSAIILDESSILKNFSGFYRNQIIENFQKTKYKLACTATPAPNDFMELGNHCEFLNIMTYSEMLSMFFVNDMSENGKWRLKKYANKNDFWKWVSSWAIAITNPAELGFNQIDFNLPKLKIHKIIVEAVNKLGNGFFTLQANTMAERHLVRKESVNSRCQKVKEIIEMQKDYPYLCWVDLNIESVTLHKKIKNSIEITGSDSIEKKEKTLIAFSENKIDVLITKPSIAGFGMNWQNCHNVFFVGLSDSWEMLYQALRRVWRFGQKKEVNCFFILEERESNILKNIERKELQTKEMSKKLTYFVKQELLNVNKINKNICNEQSQIMKLPIWK